MFQFDSKTLDLISKTCRGKKHIKLTAGFLRSPFWKACKESCHDGFFLGIAITSPYSSFSLFRKNLTA